MSDAAPERQMLSLEVPEDQPDLLKALGRLAIAHGNLEMVQIMCLKTLDRLTPEVKWTPSAGPLEHRS